MCQEEFSEPGKCVPGSLSPRCATWGHSVCDQLANLYKHVCVCWGGGGRDLVINARFQLVFGRWFVTIIVIQTQHTAVANLVTVIQT